jgi:hypothetical protein
MGICGNNENNESCPNICKSKRKKNPNNLCNRVKTKDEPDSDFDINLEEKKPIYNNIEKTEASPPPADKIINNKIEYPKLDESEQSNIENNIEKPKEKFLEKKEQSKKVKNYQNNLEKKKSNKNVNYYGKIDDKYDIIIDANSIRNLNKGWEIIYNKNEDSIKEIVHDLEKIVITVLGNSNRGKTHILQKLSGTKIPAGYQIQTKGLSIKIYDKEKLLLDTAGTNAPLLIDDEINEARPSEKEIQKIYLCQIITNYILQTFVVKISHVIICVVGMLTASEQQFICKIKKICNNQKKLYIIHNLIKCKTNDDIENYVEGTLFQSITSELDEVIIPGFEKKPNLFNRYFKEKDNNNVNHFIYGNDEGNSEEMNYYNKTTLNFINKKIRVEQKEKVNIINDLIEHVRDISSFSLTEELKTISENKELNLIKCEEKNIEPKRVLADEFDNLIFIGKDFEPMHRCYISDNNLVIEIDLCSDFKDLKVEQTYDQSTKEDVFQITGERNITNMLKEGQIIFDFMDKTEAYKNFKLEIRVKKAKYNISNIKKDYKTDLEFGILFLIFNLSFKKKK